MAEVTFDKKINTPFAESGDKTEIPEESNYELVNQKEGFTELYETPIGEGGEYIERQTINQVLYDTQSAVKEIQELGEGDGFPANLTNSNGILPVANGGTGNSSGKAPSAETADYATSAGSATTATTATNATLADSAVKLQTARTIRTNLASTSTASFDGTANITPGVTGTLPVANGGTGITSNPSMLIDLERNSSASVFASSPRPGVTGVLPIENGGTGAENVRQYHYNNGIITMSGVSIYSDYINNVTDEGIILIPRATSSSAYSYYIYNILQMTLSEDDGLTYDISSNGVYKWQYNNTKAGPSIGRPDITDLNVQLLSNINSATGKSFTTFGGYPTSYNIPYVNMFPFVSYYRGSSLGTGIGGLAGRITASNLTVSSDIPFQARGYYIDNSVYSSFYVTIIFSTYIY